MDAKQFLESREIPDYLQKITAELDAVYANGTTHPLLTKSMAALGLLFLLEAPEEERDTNFGYRRPVVYKNERYQRIAALLPENRWNDPAAWNLLLYFFGEEKATYVKYAWERIPYQMYQVNTDRRSFTAPNDPEVYFVNQLNFIVYALPQAFQVSYAPRAKTTCFELTVTEQVRYDQALNSHHLYRIWAAAIDLGNDSVLSMMEDIIFNKDTIGKVTRPIIKALLNSEKQVAWVLVEKLLLAAQRQEGLRQTILESLDETGIGALKYMTKVLLDNKMTRFSSVVRAVDVWAGLGWDAEKETTVKQFLEKAHTYLETPALIPEAMHSKNNMEVYMALWALGVSDVQTTRPYLDELLATGNAEKRCLVLKFARETKYYNINMPLFYKALEDTDEGVLGMALTGINSLVYNSGKHYDTRFPELFDRLHAVVKRTSGKEKVFTSQVFSWMNISFDRNDALQAMSTLVQQRQDRLDTMLLYFDETSLTIREQLARLIFPEHAGWGWSEQTSKAAPLTAFQRNFAIRLLKERGEFVVDVAFRALSKEQFTAGEMPVFIELLKRKSAGGRSKTIALVLRQSDDVIASVATQLLEGDTEQRLAGLDIALQLKKVNRLTNDIIGWSTSFKERKNISQREEVLLTQLSADNEGLNFSKENGYGLYDPALISPVVAPVVKPGDYYDQCQQSGAYGFSKPVAIIHDSLQALYELVLANGAHEYEVEQYDNSRAKVLLANDLSKNKPFSYRFETPAAEYASYPLPEVWEKWYQDAGLQPRDLFILNSLMLEKQEQPEVWRALIAPFYPTAEDIIPAVVREKHTYKWSNPVLRVLTALQLIHPFEERNAFLIGAATRLFASFTPEVFTYQSDGKLYPYTRGGWQNISVLNKLLDTIGTTVLKAEDINDCWQLNHWRQFTGLPESADANLPSLTVFCYAYQAGLISESEVYRGLISKDNIRQLSQPKQHKDMFNYFRHFPFLEAMFVRVREHFLDIELKRGDSPTAVTKFIPQLKEVYGIRRFAEILTGLGKTTLFRGYIYTGSDDFSRQQQFSTLLKKCYPLPHDTQALFNEAIKSLQVSEAQLIEAAVYAPQWQRFVSQYFNWKGLDAAIWWMHAHTKSSGAAEQNAEAESEIARYSAVDLADFKIGAVDKDWFQKAYKEIGKVRWQVVYDAAKYISDGNEHRRARLYADVITGDIKLKEVTQKIKDKRDQDYLRMYGLIPLSKANPDKDVLARYEYLQQFKKESRQFGAQKQTSEAVAIRIALENLARNAGYADPLRLTWAMETRQVQQILLKETQVQYDDVSIGLVIDEAGMADVVAFKGDKPLKAIPPKFKKDPKVEELAEYRKILREQFSRSEKSLEDAMVRGDNFLYTELVNLFGHPVIASHLEKLVYVAGEQHGFYHNGILRAADGTEFVLGEGDDIRIAHSADLYRLRVWSDYQRYAFDKQLQQPFKQIFRELYVPLADELAEKSVSRRYAGHQVQPSQTVALLKNRHWKVDYEEGLQKVFHKEGFVAKIYALANWFSPAEVESPTLETVIFHHLKTGQQVAFEDISPLIFSEVMRDIDLVVSVAHVGGVDPEASHSSIEMRRVLLTETLRLFKVNNVSISGNHALIKGQHGEYSVHLGSAIAHQLPGKYLSVLPVHSQHRGRLFLPFIDDDPKSAELISKVLLLAKDAEIQDPTILSQLSMN